MKETSYEVQARLVLLITKTITASSLEEAVEESKNYKCSDFVVIRGENIDDSVRITGVYETDPEMS